MAKLRLEINRRTSGDIGTQGTLILHGLRTPWVCDTLELPWENNKPRESCIMADTYRAWLWFSPTFKCMTIRLEDKHGRRNCLIHPGNFAGDLQSNRISDVEGCTLVGKGFAMITDPDSKVRQWGITASKVTLAALISKLGDAEFDVVYKWSPGCEPEDPSDHYSVRKGKT